MFNFDLLKSIDTLKQAELTYEKYAEMFKKVKISDILMNVVDSKLSFEELNEYFSKDIDILILLTEKEGVKFVGGIFKIALNDDKNFKTSYQLYFKNKDGKFLNKSAESDAFLLEYLTNEAQEKLKKEKKIEFEINEPGK